MVFVHVALASAGHPSPSSSYLPLISVVGQDTHNG